MRSEREKGEGGPKIIYEWSKNFNKKKSNFSEFTISYRSLNANAISDVYYRMWGRGGGGMLISGIIHFRWE